MTVIYKDGLDIPSIHIEKVGRRYGVVQGSEDPAETPQNALARLEQAILDDIERKTKQMVKRENAREAVLNDTYITKV